MTQAQRTVNKIPLDELWTDSERLAYKRQEYLTESQLRELVSKGNIAVAEANCGAKLSWVLPNCALAFYKKQVKGHVVNNPDRIILADYEDEWCYLASLWRDTEDGKVILLEAYH
ncbi:MAG TPA: hypothetical protein VMR70_00250 [Flavisolibacter sp.]|nr:hypothetical protein [Flavisolibacter sp.]